MTIDQRTLIFFDASCLIAAAGSPLGGSGFLLSLCAHGWIKGVVSHLVLQEAEHNIETKLGERALSRYHSLLKLVPFLVAPIPPISRQPSWLQRVNAKDVHVVAAVSAVAAPYLLTLDRQLITQINQATLQLYALTPGDFIQKVLPTHLDYPELR
jgi:predicted nucleic acid-binding protein